MVLRHSKMLLVQVWNYKKKSNTFGIFSLISPIALSVVPAGFNVLNFYFEVALCTN